EQFLAELERAACRTGDALPRHVVNGRAKPAAGNHHIDAVEGVVDHLGDAVLVIADGRSVVLVHADLAQLPGEMGGVCVVDLAKKKLCADGNDLRAHVSSRFVSDRWYNGCAGLAML